MAIRHAVRSRDPEACTQAVRDLQQDVRTELRSRPEWANATDIDLAAEVNYRVMLFLP
jgi:hypothetical protein